MIRILFLGFIILLITACANNSAVAPVVTGLKQGNASGQTYRVGKGETLYSIAWRYSLDYRALAATNHIPPPYHINVGQLLRLDETVVPASVTRVKVTPVRTIVVPSLQTRQPNRTFKVTRVAPTKLTRITVPTLGKTLSWNWPARGKIIAYFSGVNKGINIAGVKGQPVMTTGSGMVVYAGGSLRGYGKLIIIKHNDEFLSAYAHNSQILVKEGDFVKGGQVIAKMGNTDTKRVMLHFEIRRAGKPVDPLRYTQPR